MGATSVSFEVAVVATANPVSLIIFYYELHNIRDTKDILQGSLPKRGLLTISFPSKALLSGPVPYAKLTSIIGGAKSLGLVLHFLHIASLDNVFVRFNRGEHPSIGDVPFII